MIRVLYAGSDREWPAYARHLPPAAAEEGLDITLVREGPPEGIDYILYAPDSPLQDFRPFTRCRAVLNLWAGVESVVGNPTLTQPLTRMVDEGLTQGMIDWVTGHVLRHHLGLDVHIAGQDGVWREDTVPPLATARRVGILGLGELGSVCARALAGLGFPVSGWSRRQKSVEGVRCESGAAGLESVLRRSDILVLLLPLTDETLDLMDAARLAMLPAGAVLLNPGRGPLIDDAALIAALDAGRLAHATLDVFREEPLPPGHPFWAHPKVTVTPHIASATRPETAVRALATNIARAERGEPLLHLVERARGY